MLKNQASGTIVLAFLLFVLWQIIDNSFLTNVPLETRHLLFMIIATIFALIISSLATSEINRQYRRLHELETLKQDLTQMLVHDLRTPLTGMIGSLATLQNGGLGEMNPLMNEMVDIGINSAENLLEMVNDLLDISKMEAGSMDLQVRQTHLLALVESAIQHIQRQAFDKNIDLRIESIDASLDFECDEEKIRRVLVNLLGNAVKFTPSNGTITVDATKDTKGLTMRVHDTGPGIPEEFHDKIFEKFGQLDTRRSGRTKSTGLGLTFCKLAVEAHHGRIWVESEDGNGSTFKFFLPKLTAHKY